MTTPNPERACPALHILNGCMGRNSRRQPLYPTHNLTHGRCTHCHTGTKE